MKHYLRAAAAAILCAALLSSCAQDGGEVSAETTAAASQVEAVAGYTIAGVPLGQFRIVRPDYSSDSLTLTAVTLKKALGELCGAEMSLVTDWEQSDGHEIILGDTNREGGKDVGCGWSVDGGSVYIYGEDDIDLSAAAEIFARDIASAAALSDGDGEAFDYTYIKNEGTEETEMNGKYNELEYFDWGVNGHNRDYAAYPEKYLDKQIEAAARLGAKIYRFNYNPKTDAEFAYADKVVKLCEKYGMELMLVLDDDSGTPDEIYQRHLAIAKRYAGRIKYYQLFNETDVWAMRNDDGSMYHDGDGSSIADFNPERVESMCAKLLASQKAIREGDPEALTCVNFAWKHTAVLTAYAEAGVSWDITGIDWYSDMERASSITDITAVVSKLFPERDIIICECNIWAHDQYTEAEQSQYITAFADKVYAIARENERFRGMIVYELLDETAIESGDYNGEAHFGLVGCSASGTIGEVKAAYTALCDMWDGGELHAEKID